jgi:hypothetical protein
MPPKTPREPRGSGGGDEGSTGDNGSKGNTGGGNDANDNNGSNNGKDNNAGGGRITRSVTKKAAEGQRNQSPSTGGGNQPTPAPATQVQPTEQRTMKVAHYIVQDFRKGSPDDIEWHRAALEDNLRRSREAAVADPTRVRNNLLERDRIFAELCKRKKGTITRLGNELKKKEAECKAAGKLADEGRKYATALYEDFMYYQNPRNRKAFEKNTKKNTTKAQEKLAGQIGKIPMVMGLTQDQYYDQQAEPYVRGMRRSHVGVADRLKRRAIFQELHIHTPHPRRQMAGLGRPRFHRVPPIDLDLDENQIETRRHEVDSRIDYQTAGLEFRTHDERRVAQAKMDALTRTSAQLDRMRTAGGVFLAARERSDDWPTSYKCFGIVTNGMIPNIPAKVITKDDDDMPDAEDFAENKDDEADTTPISSDQLFEFARRKRPQREYEDEDMHVTTAWAEADAGRREWHEYQFLAPSSEVGSPPLAAQSEIDLDTVPDVLGARVLTSFERETYRDRQEDHYGLLEDNWPRTGLRVPYDPKSFDHVRHERSRNVGWVHPLLKAPVDLGEWEGNQGGGGGSSGDESDDEGDLFRESYMECSQAQGGGVQGGGENDGGQAPDVPTD